MNSDRASVSYVLEGAVVILRLENESGFEAQVCRQLIEAIDRAEGETGVAALLLEGLGAASEKHVAECDDGLRAICHRLEASPLLTVASLEGRICGRSAECALATHYRLAHSDASFAMAAVREGLIPATGGTQRLPRLIDAATAVDILGTGRRVPAAEALSLGFLDHVHDDKAEAAGRAIVQALLDRDAPRRPTSALPPPRPVDWVALRDEMAEKAGGRDASLAVVEAVRASTEMSFEEGLQEERRIHAALRQGPQRAAFEHAQKSLCRAAELPGLARVSCRDYRRIGLVGGGTMGAGIATAILMAGLPVTLIETSADAAASARDRIAGHLQAAVRRKRLASAKGEHALESLLIVTMDDSALSDVDLVIEAVFEDLAIKQKVFSRLGAVCRQGAVLATNTSYLDVDTLADASGRPEDVVGLHFFSPAHVMPLIEIVVPERSAPDAVATAFAFAKRLGKIPVPVGVAEGFIGNRILARYRAAADRIVLAGASPQEVDAAMTGFGFAMGPYAVADLAGLDIGWANRKRRPPQPGAARFPDRLCEAGHFGQKTGKGYYDYARGRLAVTSNPEALSLIAAERRAREIAPRQLSRNEIATEVMTAIVHEAAQVLQQGIARRPLDIDAVMLAGYGFPRHRGGPCWWSDQRGLATVLEDIRCQAAQDDGFGPPSALLLELVATGRSFADLNEDDQRSGRVRPSS